MQCVTHMRVPRVTEGIRRNDSGQTRGAPSAVLLFMGIATCRRRRPESTPEDDSSAAERAKLNAAVPFLIPHQNKAAIGPGTH
jgi:hypothetical protein